MLTFQLVARQDDSQIIHYGEDSINGADKEFSACNTQSETILP